MDVLKRLRRDPGVVVDLDRGVAELIDSLDEVKVEAKDADARKQALQARIIDALLDAEAGRLPDGRMVTYREQRSSPKVDTQALKLRHPDLYAEIVSQGTHRTLRVVKPKNQQKEN
jgi:predicted phage-related endonuclease